MTGKVLQFGTGRFLRAFIDPILPERSVTVIQSRPNAEGARQINDAGSSGYHVWTRGKSDGEIIDRFQTVRSLSRALIAARDWPEVLQLAQHPELNLVVSNTTESGLRLDERDQASTNCLEECPASYPARLMTLLWVRFKKGLPGLTILPMELVEGNADVLKRLVVEQAAMSFPSDGSDFTDWISGENRWLSNLVDRIVVGVNAKTPWEGNDPLAAVAEPFAMLAVKDDGLPRNVLPEHPMISWHDELDPLFIRKVRILNGLHTAMVARCLPLGVGTVKQVVETEEHRLWLEAILQEEILPTLSARGINASEFASQVIERFENPFFEHKLSDIANGHSAKLQTRIAPTVQEHIEAFGGTPAKLSWVLNADITREEDLHV